MDEDQFDQYIWVCGGCGEMGGSPFEICNCQSPDLRECETSLPTPAELEAAGQLRLSI